MIYSTFQEQETREIFNSILLELFLINMKCVGELVKHVVSHQCRVLLRRKTKARAKL